MPSTTTSLLFALLSTYVSAQSTTTTNTAVAQTTLRFFIDANTDQGFVGEVVTADCSETTVALQCTAGSFCASFDTGSSVPTALATFNPSSFEVSSQITSDGLLLTVLETCSLASTTSAACSASVSASLDNVQTASTTKYTLSGASATAKYFQVPITAGAEKLPTTCKSGSKGAAAPAATAMMEAWKVMVVVPGAALVAGAWA